MKPIFDNLIPLGQLSLEDLSARPQPWQPHRPLQLHRQNNSSELRWNISRCSRIKARHSIDRPLQPHRPLQLHRLVDGDGLGSRFDLAMPMPPLLHRPVVELCQEVVLLPDMVHSSSWQNGGFAIRLLMAHAWKPHGIQAVIVQQSQLACKQRGALI